MITVDENFLASPVRYVKGKVVFNPIDTTLPTLTFTESDELQKIEIQRVADSRLFFGQVVCQRLHVELRDINKEINLNDNYWIDAYIGEGDTYIQFPKFKITEINRNENNNRLSITAYDLLETAKSLQFKDVNIQPPYNMTQLARAIGIALGTTTAFKGTTKQSPLDNVQYEEGANIEPETELREVIKQIAEAAYCVVYMNSENKLVFRAMNKYKQPDFTIPKAKYYTLSTKTNRRLAGICSATQLGDNVKAELDQSGTIQYIYDNPFLELRTDIDSILNGALEEIGGLTINQFEMTNIGFPHLEIGDRLKIENKDGTYSYSYLLDDVLTYDGALKGKTQYVYEAQDDTDANPSTIGEAMKQTYARVDKVNKQVDIVVSKSEDMEKNISSIGLRTDQINLNVSETQKKVDANTREIEELKKSVSLKLDEDAVSILIQKEMKEQGAVDSVTTKTGFVFDEDGLTISKTDSDVSTKIDEDGLVITQNGTEMLTVHNQGVDAINLTARQYLIIGKYSRFQDYEITGRQRTGCFWIGE